MTTPLAQSSSFKHDNLRFHHLPPYCRFLLAGHLEAFAIEQLRLAREIKVPLLKYLEGMPEEQLVALAVQGARELFEHIIAGTLGEFLTKSNEEWKRNQLPIISQENVVAEDITLVSYARKCGFRNFLPLYSSDLKMYQSVMEEVDRFILKSETLSFQTYADILTQRLQRNEELYKQAQAISHLGNWTWNVTEDRIEWTDELYRIFGMQPQSEPITFDRYAALIHPDDRDAAMGTVQRSLEMKQPFEFYHRAVRPDGSVRFIHSKGEVRLDDNGAVVQMFGTGQDLTEDAERKRTENLLRESEQRFRSVADTVPVLVWMSNTNKERFFFNKTWLAFTGRTTEQEHGIGWLKGVHPDDRERCLHTFYQAHDDRKEFTMEYRLRRHDGEYRWMMSVGVPRFDREQTFLGLIGSATDVHERKLYRELLEEQVKERTSALMRANMELERSNKELSSFSYVASHDLQEPLRKIQTFSSRVLERDYDRLSDTGKDSLKRMNDAALRMKKLIEDLLAYSRTNTATRTFEAVDLNRILEEIKVTNAEKIAEKNVTLTAEKLPVVQGMDYQLTQLFENLIGNSIKYAKPDVPPRITIVTKVVNGDAIESLDPAARYHEITFSDNGIGFEQKHARRIFEVFQRLHNRTDYEGTGIGLAICKKIVENHGGCIVAEGTPDAGAVFRVYFPVS